MELNEDAEIEVITDDDETLKTLGELLSNKTSRDLLKFLMHKEAYKMKISDELGVPFSLVEHHLKKMEKLGLVKITNKQIVKGGVLHKTYKITATGILILLNNTKEEIKERGTLKKIFKEGVKFTAVGIAGVITWFGTQQYTPVIIDKGIITRPGLDDISTPSNLVPQISMEPTFSLIPIIATAIVVSVCFFLIRFSKK